MSAILYSISFLMMNGYFLVVVFLLHRRRRQSYVIRKRVPDFVIIASSSSLLASNLFFLSLKPFDAITKDMPCVLFFWSTYLIITIWICSKILFCCQTLFSFFIHNAKASSLKNFNFLADEMGRNYDRFLCFPDEIMTEFEKNNANVGMLAKFDRWIRILIVSFYIFVKGPSNVYITPGKKGKRVATLVKFPSTTVFPEVSSSESIKKVMSVSGFSIKDLIRLCLIMLTINLVIVIIYHFTDSSLTLSKLTYGSPYCPITSYIPLMIEILFCYFFVGLTLVALRNFNDPNRLRLEIVIDYVIFSVTGVLELGFFIGLNGFPNFSIFTGPTFPICIYLILVHGISHMLPLIVDQRVTRKMQYIRYETQNFERILKNPTLYSKLRQEMADGHCIENSLFHEMAEYLNVWYQSRLSELQSTAAAAAAAAAAANQNINDDGNFESDSSGVRRGNTNAIINKIANRGHFDRNLPDGATTSRSLTQATTASITFSQTITRSMLANNLPDNVGVPSFRDRNDQTVSSNGSCIDPGAISNQNLKETRFGEDEEKLLKLKAQEDQKRFFESNISSSLFLLTEMFVNHGSPYELCLSPQTRESFYNAIKEINRGQKTFPDILGIIHTDVKKTIFTNVYPRFIIANRGMIENQGSIQRQQQQQQQQQKQQQHYHRQQSASNLSALALNKGP